MQSTINWKSEDGQHLESSSESRLRQIFPWLIEDLRSFVQNDLRGNCLLEIGCGPGFMIEHFFEALEIPVFAVDISFKMLKKSAESGRLANSIPLVADVEKLPFDKNSFDIVFSRGSVFFWQNIELAFVSIYDILKPGGTAIIGGGYGLKTPMPLIEELKKERPEKNNRIPRLDLDNLLAIAMRTGGKCELHQAPKRGFWIIIRKP